MGHQRGGASAVRLERYSIFIKDGEGRSRQKDQLEQKCRGLREQGVAGELQTILSSEGASSTKPVQM